MFFDTGKEGYIIFSYLVGGLLVVPLTLSIVSLVRILRLAKQLRYSLGAMAVIFICVFFAIVMSASGRKVREDINGVRCSWHLNELGKAIMAYSKDNDGYLPTADRWCDLLLEHDANLPQDFFTCPATRGQNCSYAFNRNLGGLRLADVPGDAVLVYEAGGGWNTAGTAELLTVNHPNGRTFVLLADGDVRLYRAEKLIKEPLCWEP
ncbi:MAG: hypothetical protein JSV99_01150 [Planctomycetota bacterium]|nr:MAG: hypothetical protein JSV99_01150 [Planctomycetota bacterium]